MKKKVVICYRTVSRMVSKLRGEFNLSFDLEMVAFQLAANQKYLNCFLSFVI